MCYDGLCKEKEVEIMEREYPRITVTKKAEKALRGGHPWVYADEVRFGCRSFCVDPSRGFLLNGKEYPLRVKSPLSITTLKKPF